MRIIILLLTMLSTSVASAGHLIEVTEPAFTAEKIELNPVTNTYVVVNPKYFVNAEKAIKIVASGLTRGVNISKTAQHLCIFLGMSGGKIISTSRVAYYNCNAETLTIEDSGLYSSTRFAPSYSDCHVIDFLECSPK